MGEGIAALNHTSTTTTMGGQTLDRGVNQSYIGKPTESSQVHVNFVDIVVASNVAWQHSTVGRMDRRSNQRHAHAVFETPGTVLGHAQHF